MSRHISFGRMGRQFINAFGLAGAVFSSVAMAQPSLSAADSAAKAATPTPFSEERNAGVGFVATQTYFVGCMASVCQPLLGQAETFPADLVAKWRTANMPYVRATTAYLADLLKSFPDPQAGKSLLARLNASVQAKGQAAVSEAMAGADEDRKTACMKFVIQFAEGRFHVSDQGPFFITLRGLVNDYR